MSTVLRPREVPDWLLARGRHFATTNELAELVGIEPAKLHLSLNRVRAARKIVSVTKGGWVPVAPEYRDAGAPPPLLYIDQLMHHLDHPYYVGLLSAARLHGASHQAPMVVQVVTPARLRDRTVGSSRIQFIRRSGTADRPIQQHNVPTGRVIISTVETTILDLVEAPNLAAGLGNVATIIGDLALDQRIDPKAIAKAASLYPATVAQRAGYLIEHMCSVSGAAPIDLNRLAADIANTDFTSLDPRTPADGDRNEQWRIIINAAVEHDL